MYPALQAGNNVLVNKWIMGTRIFNIWDALEGKEVKIHRLPGDTLEIRNGFYRIRGTEEELGNIAAQRRISGLTENNLRGVVMESFRGANGWDGR